MNKKAFTFIELIVVVSILVLITATSGVYFFRQIAGLQLNAQLESIATIVNSLDSEVGSRIILDYEININTTNNKEGLSYTTNTLGLEHIQMLDFNSSTGIGELSTNLNLTGSTYVFKVYNKSKFISTSIVDGTDAFTANFRSGRKYHITGTLSEDILNTLYVSYYSEDESDSIELSGINSQSDKMGIPYTSLIIKNINGKKNILGNGLDSLTEVYLFFERDGIEKFIEIKK